MKNNTKNMTQEKKTDNTMAKAINLCVGPNDSALFHVKQLIV